MPRRKKVVLGTGYTPKWPGDPGNGNYYVGWAEPESIATGRSWTPNPPDLSVYHTYAGAAAPNITDVNNATNAGLIASHTFRPAVASVNDGTYDSAIDSFANAVAAKAPHPVWLCYRHEPESEFTTTQQFSDYRTAYRRVVQRFRNLGVTNVAWTTIFMNPWTFENASGRDWRNYHPDWTGSGWNDDIMMDMMGLDTYSPLPYSTNYVSMDYMMNLARSKIELNGYPVWDYIIPEFGMSAQASPTPDWTVFASQFIAQARAHNIKSVCYWNNAFELGGETDHYSFDALNDPNGTKLTAWEMIAEGAVNWSL